MHAQNPLAIFLIAVGMLASLGCAGRASPESAQAQSQVQMAVQKVAMGDYEVVENWPKPLPDTDLPHAGWTWGSGAGVFAESPDKVWVSQRGEIELPPGATPWICPCLLTPRRTNTGRRPYSGRGYTYQMRRHHLVFAVDRNGNTIEEWLQHDKLSRSPEGLGTWRSGPGPAQAADQPVRSPRSTSGSWTTTMHFINVFTNDGKLVKTMGEKGVPGRGPNNFNRPTDIAWLPDGTFFVADGYAGTRVAKFDRDGKFLMDWGRPPVDPNKPGPNEFWSVHSIGISRDRRLFVADREHHRMQVFDENGKFLEMWPTGHDSAILAHIVTQDDYVWVSDWTTDRLIKYDLNGRYILDIGGHGPQPGQFDGVHQISVDQERNLYVTEVQNDRSQKFRPKPDADPAKIVGPPVGGWP